MSFDVFLLSCSRTGKTNSRPNPFTGQLMEVPVMAPMDAAVAELIRKRLVELGTEVDANGSATLQLPDGGHAEINASELFCQEECTSLALNVYSNSSSMVDLIYEISNTAGFAIQAAMEDSRAIVTRPALLSSAREIFGEACVSATPDQLQTLLAEGFSDFESYRDK
ncbi:hypothetical protein [Gimesia maris]|uniref:Uncharacterized protein n=1 Tax=Gimesia maris TaxID=122 RepID=A0ABX5YK93_9PLAN|nr:hypothetical protein [Gimesia maris]QEG16098.1 hypothetical protein GmarT_19590 [Gimesia maris]QGQ30659.1 hypothetical protein F1729_19520 [Gimesia maris]